MDDRDIVALYEERSERAIRETDGKYGRYCRYIADRILGSREDVEECVNDTWLCTWNAIPPHKPENLKAFVGKLVRNNAIKKYKKCNAEKRRDSQYTVALEEIGTVISDSSESTSAVDRIALRDALDRFLGGLPKRTRIVFMKRYWYMNSICEIADELGMSDGSVRILLHRTREQLKKFLTKEDLML